MEKVIFSNKGGIGFILDENELLTDYVLLKPVILHGVKLEPNSYTDLDGMFSGKVIYKGCLKEENAFEIMVFFVGVDGQEYNGKHYYQCFYRIDENRIANKYKENTLRDFHWKEGKWK